MTNEINTILNKMGKTNNEDARTNVYTRMCKKYKFYELAQNDAEIDELLIMMNNDFIPERIRSDREYVSGLYSYHNGQIDAMEDCFYEEYGSNWSDEVDEDHYIRLYEDFYYEFASCML